MNSMTYGTSTSPAELIIPSSMAASARIADIRVDQKSVTLYLDDGRAILLDLSRYDWLRWLYSATPEQQADWEIVPSGGGVWWLPLDNGIELQPLLDRQLLA